jgi:sugar phosphate isomerase/epimerase
MAYQPLVGVNLHSLRDHCRTEADLDRSLGLVKAMGIPSVQVSGIGPIEPRTIRSLLDRHGLAACAAHEGFECLARSPEEVRAKLEALGCAFTALGYPGDEMFEAGRWEELRAVLEKAGRFLASKGLKLGYHNHFQEFQDQGGRRLLDWLFESTSADYLLAEPDTAWIQLGGGSPEAWVRRLAGRIGALHLKDYTWAPDRVRLCEVGRGNLDWPGIFSACRDTAVPILIIEQDDPVAERGIFASIEISYRAILEFLGKEYAA